MGTLMTLDLLPGAPVARLPWVITIGPLGEQDWDPVVCGPYERRHALALAEAVVADEPLLAVVEPLMPCASADDIRAEIIRARVAAEAEPADEGFDAGTYEARRVRPGPEPSAQQVRAGWERIAAQLTGGGPPDQP